jgi:hypothetical protein
LIDQNLILRHKRTSTYSKKDYADLLHLETIRGLTAQTSEKYLTSKIGVSSAYFVSDGLTDSLLVELGKERDLLVTADSSLSNIATANGINVYDIVQRRNKNLRK